MGNLISEITEAVADTVATLVVTPATSVRSLFFHLFNFFSAPPAAFSSTLLQIQTHLEEGRLISSSTSGLERKECMLKLATLREEHSILQNAPVRAQKAKATLRKGVRPVVWPTEEQFSTAIRQVQYDTAKFHFAISGTSGSGKSSLINAFRGLKPSDDAAAKVGAVECTTKVTRYPDPRNEIPYSRFVWYDIPGAGTLNVPDWQYFNDQGLFAFDFIIIVYDGRFTKIDAAIIKNCLLFEIPFFVVRSKADQHIQNLMNDKEAQECERQVITTEYVNDTRSNLAANLKKIAEAPELDEESRQLLLNHRVYIVSQSTLRRVFQMTMSEETTRVLQQSTFIDDYLLIDDMLKQALRRRYPDPDKLLEDVESLWKTHSESIFIKEALCKDIRPVVPPTHEQFLAAKQRVQFDPAKFHFAVCGTFASGKSSIINAFRGLKPSDEGAAKVAVTKRTSEVTRYPDPRNQIPYSEFVWYHIRGAGTISLPAWQYFNNLGLFVFDLIIMVYDVRFTKIDVGIIENCLRFNIPLLFVRSKSDQHIENMIKAETDCVPGDIEYEEKYQKMTEKYVKATRSDFNDHMEIMAQNPDIDSRYQLLLRNHKVYIISESTLRGLLQMKRNAGERRTPNQSRIIDEAILIEDMLKQAARRRCRSPDKLKISFENSKLNSRQLVA